MKQCCKDNDGHAIIAYTMFFVLICLWVIFHISYINIVVITCISICFVGDISHFCNLIEFKDKKLNRSSWQFTMIAGFIYMLFMAYYGQFTWGLILCSSYIMRSFNMKKYWKEQDKLFSLGKKLICK